MRPSRIKNVLALCLLWLALHSAEASAEHLKAVATISIIGDVIKQVAGDAVDLTVLVGPDGDAHEYEPVPADSVHLAQADIIFENGLHLEHWLDKLYSASGSKAERVTVSEGVRPIMLPDNPRETDPHAWQDVENVVLYTQHVRDALTAVDPADQAQFSANAQKYIEQLKALDLWVKGQVASIPVDRRKLVTNHDALGYFARAYGFQIIGAVIPSATTEAADPSAQETARLLDIIKANGVHAVFAENMANPKLAKALAQEAGVRMGPGLYTDALGPAGSAGDSYIKMIRFNVQVFTDYLK